MQPVDIEKIKCQAAETPRLVSDMEITGVGFDECQIIQVDMMELTTPRNEIKEETKMIQEGNKDLTIIINRDGDLFSWSVLADNPGWMAKRNEIIGAA